MKALSLRQPWAELVLTGKKPIETRTWNTKFRGRFIIHASMQYDHEKVRTCGFADGTLPTGCLVGEATLVDVIAYPDDETFLADSKRHCVTRVKNEKKKYYGYVLTNVVRYEKPIPCKGALNFFEPHK